MQATPNTVMATNMETTEMMRASGKFHDELIKTAKEIGAPGKGILAADESTGTIGKRFA